MMMILMTMMMIVVVMMHHHRFKNYVHRINTQRDSAVSTISLIL